MDEELSLILGRRGGGGRTSGRIQPNPMIPMINKRRKIRDSSEIQ
jgi:hypothetical protein